MTPSSIRKEVYNICGSPESVKKEAPLAYRHGTGILPVFMGGTPMPRRVLQESPKTKKPVPAATYQQKQA
jgi:hypothetical protein